VIITTKSKSFGGTVTIYDRLVLSQVELVENALLSNPTPDEGGRVRFTDLDRPKLPALLACVEKWDLANFPDPVTVDNFPLTPRKQAHDLIEQIFDAIKIIYNGEVEIPNA